MLLKKHNQILGISFCDVLRVEPLTADVLIIIITESIYSLWIKAQLSWVWVQKLTYNNSNPALTTGGKAQGVAQRTLKICIIKDEQN